MEEEQEMTEKRTRDRELRDGRLVPLAPCGRTYRHTSSSHVGPVREGEEEGTEGGKKGKRAGEW